jgi:NADH pyrophosphatase NudC (nudix superfamily)
MRLIDADRLTRPEMLRMCYHLPNGDTAMPIGDIEHAPTVEAVPVKHGRWELVDAAEPQRYGCSNCSCLSWYGTYRYCPNCGAKMDLEEQDAQTEQPGK